MSACIKSQLASKICQLVRNPRLTIDQIKPLINISIKPQPIVALRRDKLSKELNLPDQFSIDYEPDDIVSNVETSSNCYKFSINANYFVKTVLDHCLVNPHINVCPKRNIVVDYSSINVAKPFHLGHLRSTIIGHFFYNINDALFGHNVTSINYLGDWGTQIGLVKVGLDDLGLNVNTISENPLEHLYKCYVHATKLTERDPSIIVKARTEFHMLEAGRTDMEYWITCMKYTVQGLVKMYKRLGVHFDEFHYESMYRADKIKTLINALIDCKAITQANPSDPYVAHVNINDRVEPVVILKGDGTTLYLTRDIAAAIDRFNRYQFDELWYVVDKSQSNHFKALIFLIEKLGHRWSNRIHHLRFGRIRGMQSRRGNAIFLHDILDEAKEIVRLKQKASSNTKVSLTDDYTSDILASSCIIINDLKQRRQTDYDFDWDTALKFEGDSGIKLQYTHCRLVHLEQNCGYTACNEVKPEYLLEAEALHLINHMATFYDTLYRSYDQKEACILVSYLFSLCAYVNRALKVLRIKGSDLEVGSQRLLLFQKAQLILGTGMKILGLQPLQKM